MPGVHDSDPNVKIHGLKYIYSLVHIFYQVIGNSTGIFFCHFNPLNSDNNTQTDHPGIRIILSSGVLKQ